MGELILIAGLLMAIALGASLLATRLRVPSLVLFLGLGIALGSEGLGFAEFDDYALARDIGILALALIIYEGGLSTRFGDLRPLIGTAMSLSVLGTLLTALLTGTAAMLLLGLPFLEAMLLGSIVASTDAAAVFALLRGSALRPRLARLLEGEAGSNDPIAVLLVLGCIDLIMVPGYGAADLGWLVCKQIGLGVAVGVGAGLLGARVIRAIDLASPGLYPVATLCVGALAFGIPDVLGGSGFLAVYLCGLVLGSSRIPALRAITAFHDGLAWVAQLSMFLTLGLLVFPSQLGGVAIEGLALALILAFVARPLASLAATALSDLAPAERVVIGWAGLRGAVPVVLATFPVLAGVPQSLEFFNIVFFAVLVSLLLQGPTIVPLARHLGVVTDVPERHDAIVEVATLQALGGEAIEYTVRPGDAAAGARVRDLGLPRDAIVVVVVRDGEAIPPRGSTRLRAGDTLHILVRREHREELADLTERWRDGPLGPAPRPARVRRSHRPVFLVAPAGPHLLEGPARQPASVAGRAVVAVLRARRDSPGALAVLDDGRYALTGTHVAVGGAADMRRYLQRRLESAADDEAAWLETAIGALAADFRAAHSRPLLG